MELTTFANADYGRCSDTKGPISKMSLSLGGGATLNTGIKIPGKATPEYVVELQKASIAYCLTGTQ
uniref:Uncharacterized protein n=1 Tax=Physcomitrium patens TaxID=3218 RepID=A0A7I4CV44_PHYPA